MTFSARFFFVWKCWTQYFKYSLRRRYDSSTSWLIEHCSCTRKPQFEQSRQTIIMKFWDKFSILPSSGCAAEQNRSLWSTAKHKIQKYSLAKSRREWLHDFVFDYKHKKRFSGVPFRLPIDIMTAGAAHLALNARTITQRLWISISSSRQRNWTWISAMNILTTVLLYKIGCFLTIFIYSF